MVLNKKYQSQESAIASYNWSDISSGEGKNRYYGYTTSGGAHLSEIDIYSNNITSLFDLLATGKAGTRDFNLNFNKPAQINGGIIVSLCYGIVPNADASPEALTAYVSGAVVLTRNSAETILGKFITDVITTTYGVTGTVSKRNTCKISVSDVTIKKDDILTIRTDVMGTRLGDSTGRTGLGNDPQNRNDDGTGANKIINDTDDTILEVVIPYKIDL